MKMPVLFVGHGSPMNAIEENGFTDGWREIAGAIPHPEAILSISAHWLTSGTRVLSASQPSTIHDFWGFPDELYQIGYPAKGDPELAKAALSVLEGTKEATLDSTWGLDHGTWSVLRKMYPLAEIPVIQLSIDLSLPAGDHYDIGSALSRLRNSGVLIMGSGNIVHNLGIIDWNNPLGGYGWASEFDERVCRLLSSRDDRSLIDFEGLGRSADLAIPTADHYVPLLYALGAAQGEEPRFFNRQCVYGSISMTAVVCG